MNDDEIKQKRNTIFSQMKMGEERFDTASFIIEREASVDAIPILFKAVDITIKILLAFKQMPLGDFPKNIKSLEEEYKKEKLYDEETIELFHSLYEMNEKYISETELEYDDSAVKSIFEKAERFQGKTHKYLKAQLTTSKERMIQRRARKILVVSCISIAFLVVVFFLVKLGIDEFGPEHGLLARYYDNIHLRGPAVVEKIDKKIDFQLGSLSPHRKIGNEFSVRWEGQIKIDKSDNYTFYVLSDEGVRLFLDDEVIVDTWSNKKRPLEHSGNIKLKEGFHKIKIEYFFNQQLADIKLLWKSRSFKKKTVGKKVLYPPPELEASK